MLIAVNPRSDPRTLAFLAVFLAFAWLLKRMWPTKPPEDGAP